MKLLAKISEEKATEALSEFLANRTEIQLLTNLAFKITEFRAELPISCFTARSSGYLAIRICHSLTEKSISLPITAS